jgi:hypothetical protein
MAAAKVGCRPVEEIYNYQGLPVLAIKRRSYQPRLQLTR